MEKLSVKRSPQVDKRKETVEKALIKPRRLRIKRGQLQEIPCRPVDNAGMLRKAGVDNCLETVENLFENVDNSLLFQEEKKGAGGERQENGG